MSEETKAQMMRYPTGDNRRRVRGPVIEIRDEHGNATKRRLYIRCTRVMSHALAAELRARVHTQTNEGAEAQ